MPRTLIIWIFRLLGAIALSVSLLAGAESSPLVDPDPLAAEVIVSPTETVVEAPVPLGSLDPESITAPATVDPVHPVRCPDAAALPVGWFPQLRAPPRRPPRASV